MGYSYASGKACSQPVLPRNASLFTAWCLLLLFTAAQASLPADGSSSSDPAITAVEWTDPLPGVKPLFGIQTRFFDVGRRDCLANGSNYCFGNNVDFCPNCFACCSGTAKVCCSSGSLCCGSGCCSSGQMCSNGKCINPASTVTVTSTSTVIQTITRLATVIVSVVQAEVDFSTIFSTTRTTVNAATQTNFIYTTTTVGVAKRAVEIARQAVVNLTVPGSARHHDTPEERAALKERGDAEVTGSVQERSVEGQREGKEAMLDGFARVIRRQNSGATSTSTVLVTVTSNVETTSTTTQTITMPSTSVQVTTIIETDTIASNAQTTVTATTTVSLTVHRPSFGTYTQTGAPIIASTASSPGAGPTLSTSSTGSTTSLTPGAIAGVAVGSLIGLVALVLAFICIPPFVRRRREQKAAEAGMAGSDDSYDPNRFSSQPYDPHVMRESVGYRGTNNRVFAISTPVHHAATFDTEAAGASAAAAAQGGQYGHNRNSSGLTGFTTLTSVGGGGQQPYSKSPRPVSEVQGSVVSERHEADGIPVASSPPLSATSSGWGAGDNGYGGGGASAGAGVGVGRHHSMASWTSAGSVYPNEAAGELDAASP